MSVNVVCPGCGTVNRVPADRLAAEAGAARCPKCGTGLFPGRPLAVGGAALDRHVAKSDLPVVVDFFATWCGPCRAMAPAFAEAAGRLAARARFLQVDIDAESEAAARFAIRSVPTMVLFRGGREVARTSGAMTAAGIADFVTRPA